MTTTNDDIQTDTAQSTPPVTIITNTARFQLGQCVATPGALALLEKTRFSAAFLINRHLHGDWGDVCKEDNASNEFAVRNRQRILSVYRLVDANKLSVIPKRLRSELPTVWIITEADRSSTTILLPSEY